MLNCWVPMLMQANFPIYLGDKSVICGDIEVAVESLRQACQNKKYGCKQTLDYVKRSEHEETCSYAPCTCPLQECDFVGSSEQLSLHFSSKHWDSGRRFSYNCPQAICLGMREQFLVLQAEEDGVLFLLNKGTETIGNTVMMSCIKPSSSNEKFLYDIVAGRGISSLRLKSFTQNFPGRLEGGFPTVDFLLVPFQFLNLSGQLNVEVCIWNSTELGAE